LKVVIQNIYYEDDPFEKAQTMKFLVSKSAMLTTYFAKLVYILQRLSE